MVVTDDSGNASVGTVSVVIQDSTSPDVIAALEYTHKPSKKNDDDDDDGGSGNWHKVVAKAVDLCDANPVVTALITQPLIGSDVLDVKYKQDRKKTEIDIKIKDRKIDVTLRGVSEGVMRGLLNQAIMQGGFTVVNGQIINAKATASEKEKDDDDDDNKNKHKDDRKGDYQYAFDASLNLEEAKGVYLSLVVSAKDASGNMSDPVSAQPKKQKASKPALSKPALADDVGEVETAVMLTFGAKNFPNPFNPETMIQYTVPEVSDVRLVIYSSLGQQVRELVNASQSAGQYSVRWDGKDALGRSVSSGVYFYHLIAGSNSAINKMVLMK